MKEQFDSLNVPYTGAWDERLRTRWYEELDELEQIPLYPQGQAPGQPAGDRVNRPPCVAFFPPHVQSRGMVLIMAGGGFLVKGLEEGYCVGKAFHDAGFQAALLDYRVKPCTPQDAIADCRRAVRVLRANSERLHFPKDKLAVLGFSAGGMIAGMVSTVFDAGDPHADDPIARESSRPDACVSCYASFSSLTFPEKQVSEHARSAQECWALSPDRNLRPDCPPFFIWQTGDDDPRYPMNMGMQLAIYRIPFELHFFPEGKHGLGLATGDYGWPKDAHVAHWKQLCVEWLEGLGF